MEEHWEDVGPNNGWLGGHGDSWERGPYYLDGLVPLAYLLEDETLIQKVQPWIEWTLSSQKEDGSFGPNTLRQLNTVIGNNQDWWQEMIMLKVLTQYAEATGDKRIIPFMTKYFDYLFKALVDFPLKEWAEARGADLLLSIHWLYERTNNSALLELAELVRKQTIDWSEIFAKFPYWRKQEHWDHRIHVVNVAMAIKAPAVFARQTGNSEEKEAVYNGIKSLMTYHGQAHGMFSGDEWLSGTHPSQGVELCAVVEYMYSMENLIRILGDGLFGDILERVAFNALPATISADWDAHQYDQQVNQIICNNASRPWSNADDANMFGLEPNFGCCTANMHQGWPKLTKSLWMSTQEQGLAAISYAPCRIESTVAERTEVTINVKGDYPFNEDVTIDIELAKEVYFPLYLRVPSWCCSSMEIIVNGEKQVLNVNNGFAVLKRKWGRRTLIELCLPMSVAWEERNNKAVSITRGPLVYALPLGEQWLKVCERERFHDWEVYPTSTWQYALIKNSVPEIKQGELSLQPFQTANPPLKLKVKGKKSSPTGGWKITQLESRR